MSTVQEIKDAISHLTPAEFKEFRAWFEQYQLEADLRAGRFDNRNGRTTPL